jgi:hypothetical protein
MRYAIKYIKTDLGIRYEINRSVKVCPSGISIKFLPFHITRIEIENNCYDT